MSRARRWRCANILPAVNRFSRLRMQAGSPAVWLHTTLYGRPHAWEVTPQSLARIAATCEPRRFRLSSCEKQGETRWPLQRMSGARLKKVLAALEGNWQAEMEGYHTYQALAERDTDPVRAQVLRHLAAGRAGARRAVGTAASRNWADPSRLQRQPRRRSRLAGQPRRRRPHGPAPA